MRIERFEDLKSWQEARKLTQSVYGLTKGEAFREDRTLVWQIRDAAVSIMSNIAEAHGRYSFEDKRRFLDITFGSCAEVQSHLYVALDQAYITKADFETVYQQAQLVGRLISGSLTNLGRQIDGRSSTRSRTQRKEKQLSQK
jgi:four helix bundle protein